MMLVRRVIDEDDEVLVCVYVNVWFVCETCCVIE